MYINFKDSRGQSSSLPEASKKLNIVKLFCADEEGGSRGGAKDQWNWWEAFIKDKNQRNWLSESFFKSPPVVKYYKPSTLHNMKTLWTNA